jgi:3-hydroxyisobutyrate dehydrogenase and related beta-hydroxyacid dehydrogenases
MDIGFIGLGNMGRGMVQSLLRAGHRVVVWNRTPERADELVALGAERAATPFEAAEVGVVFTMLADDAATEAVVAGPHGILAGLPRDGGYRARIRNHGHSCFLCEIVIRSQFHTTYEPEA